MPFIKISSLQNVPKREQIMKNVEQALYAIKVNGIKLIPDNMATCMWQTLDIVVHSNDAHRIFNKTDDEIPIFVDLYMNTVFNQDGISLVMETIADELSNIGEINRDNVVIMVHVGKPGYIFINGDIDDCLINKKK
ncbi:MAG: hypothetical protein GQ564_09715 [Bacteroidales bacterium]|nr:hypothetical protein [Bacteroidales bacterium]